MQRLVELFEQLPLRRTHEQVDAVLGLNWDKVHVGQEINHLESAKIESEFFELVQTENLLVALLLMIVRALVDNVLNKVDFFVNLVDFERGHHFTPLDRQNVFEFTEQKIALDDVKEGNVGSYLRLIVWLAGRFCL